MPDTTCPRCHRTFAADKLKSHYAKAHGGKPPMDPKKKATIAVAVFVALGAGIAIAVASGAFDPPPADIAFHIDGSPRMGSEDAPVQLIAFESPQCPSCRLFHVPRNGGESTFDRIVESYVNTGKVRYVEKTFFIGEPWEERAASAQKCAWHRSEPSFFNLTHSIYAEAQGTYFSSLPDSYLENFAAREGFDVGAFMTCVNQDKYRHEIEQDVQDGMRAGVRGTPNFFIIAPDGTRTLISGAQPYATFRDAIEQALGGAGQ